MTETMTCGIGMRAVRKCAQAKRLGWNRGVILALGLLAFGIQPALAGPPTAVATPSVLTFKNAAVGIAAGSAQLQTVNFLVSGYTGSFTPTVSLHYGKDYSFQDLPPRSGNRIRCTALTSTSEK